MAGKDSSSEPAGNDRTTVLEIFGMKLSVKNRRLAEVLTMDAAEAFGLESRGSREAKALADSSAPRELMAEAAPDVVITKPLVEGDAELRLRAEMRRRADRVGAGLGFDVGDGGTWLSPLGFTVHTRIVARPLSAAAATDVVDKLASLVVSRASSTDSVLLIVVSSDARDALLRAVRQRVVHGSFRVAVVEDLERLLALCDDTGMGHTEAAAVLVPHVAVDVGSAMLIPESSMRSGHTPPDNR